MIVVKSVLFKEIFREIDVAFLDGKFFSVQGFKCGFFSLEVEFQLVGIECLILISRLPILAVHAVFSVAQKGMADVRHVRTDLVRAPREKLNLQQCAVSTLGDHLIARDDLLCAARRIFVKYLHLLFLFIL